jgi:hypothetical protein
MIQQLAIHTIYPRDCYRGQDRLSFVIASVQIFNLP